MKSEAFPILLRDEASYDCLERARVSPLLLFQADSVGYHPAKKLFWLYPDQRGVKTSNLEHMLVPILVQGGEQPLTAKGSESFKAQIRRLARCCKFATRYGTRRKAPGFRAVGDDAHL